MKAALIAVMNYTVDPGESLKDEYNFACIDFKDELKQKFNASRKLVQNNGAQFIQLEGEVPVYRSAYFYEDEFLERYPELKNIKLDSVTYLEQEPTFKNYYHLDTRGFLVFESKKWHLQLEYYRGVEFPIILFRSARLPYPL